MLCNRHVYITPRPPPKKKIRAPLPNYLPQYGDTFRIFSVNPEPHCYFGFFARWMLTYVCTQRKCLCWKYQPQPLRHYTPAINTTAAYCGNHIKRMATLRALNAGVLPLNFVVRVTTTFYALYRTVPYVQCGNPSDFRWTQTQTSKTCNGGAEPDSSPRHNRPCIRQYTSSAGRCAGQFNTLRTGLLNCLYARSRGLTFRHRASCI